MKVKTLNGILKLIDRISNPGSLTPLFRSVQIEPGSIKACSEYGNIQILLEEDTGIKERVLLDHSSLIAVTSSLPQTGELTLVEEENKVSWSCGNAKGELHYVSSDHWVETIVHDVYPWNPPNDFSNALLLASCACQAAAVSVGLYGISIEPVEDQLYMTSCNTYALASTSVAKGTFPSEKKVTIRPPVPGIISALLQACPDTMMDITEDGIFLLGNWLMAHLPLGQSLDRDLMALSNKFSDKKEEAKINSIAVKKFVTRAKNLTEKKQNFIVSLQVEEGKLTLKHAGIASSTEEWVLAEGLDSSITYAAVDLPADLLLLPLEFVQSLECSFLKDQQLVLRGDNPNFTYVLGGN